MDFYASCPEGFETELAQELRELGLTQVRKLAGRVSFTGTAADVQRACMYSRLASRMFVIIKRFTCRNASDLYEAVSRIAWEDILAPQSTIAVSAKGTNDELRNTRYTALLVKDAVCDRMLDISGQRLQVNPHDPDVRLSIVLRNTKASLSLDLAGQPLFRRLPREALSSNLGYLLRPDYAAFILRQTGWVRAQAQSPTPLIDICCAGGGILLEAASIASNRAPGLQRTRWGFMGWKQYDQRAWEDLCVAAQKEITHLDVHQTPLFATDPDTYTAAQTKRLMEQLNLPGVITVVTRGLTELPHVCEKHGVASFEHHVIFCDLTSLDTQLARSTILAATSLLDSSAQSNATFAVLTRDALPTTMLGSQPALNTQLRLHDDTACLQVFHTPSPSLQEEERLTIAVGDKTISVVMTESSQFAARLKKVARLRRRWANRSGITCYRVYDADLPDYAAAIDVYQECCGTTHVVIAEYTPPHTVDPLRAHMRLTDMINLTSHILDIPPHLVHVRSRARSRGGSQYAQHHVRDASQAAKKALIQEDGLRFAIDFETYLDTGIFLDHRITRHLVRKMACDNPRFLNLFAYTGTATCYAAAGGAKTTTTVDLSNTYLDWAQDNMALNGYTQDTHRYVRHDVLSWVEQQAQHHAQWDLIFCDPPTFSNSSRMNGRTWDVQRDHVMLLRMLAQLLAPQGTCIFSCNLRTFKLDHKALQDSGLSIKSITSETIPEDFSRNPKIHHCFILQHNNHLEP